MLVITAEQIAGREITKVIGMVKGNVIRAKHIGSDIVAGLRNLVGGEVHDTPNSLPPRASRQWTG